MECNKEEAIRAKGIAENKMQNKDFPGARKIALKAQKLYTDLENISQMLMVCDVHCAADHKLFGNEMDWYGILQIEQTADEATIRKQYRKFALLLHPDKNKFPGAEAAFKLIGEAQRVLLDPGKRSLHDMKRRASVSKPVAPYRPQQKPSWPSNVGMHNNIGTNFTGLNPQQQQRQPPAQPGYCNGRPTFWTTCPFCSVRYQFYREVIHKSIRCQSCSKPFIAYESYGPEAPRPPNFSRTASSQQSFPNQGGCKMEQVRPGNFVAENSKTQFSPKPGAASAVGVEKSNGNRKRKQVEESSESCDSESSSDAEEDVVMDENGDIQSKQNTGGSGVECPRRSERHRQKVSYKENLSDDDEMSPPKKAKGSGSSCATDDKSGDVSKEEASKATKQSAEAGGVIEQEILKQNENASFEKVLLDGKEQNENVNGKRPTVEDDCKRSTGTRPDDIKENADIDYSSDSSTKDPETYSYPDPDFNDFDKDREEERFAVGQTWAVYDTVDAMPRFYARIRKVFSPMFKLRITWLEPDPDDENEMKWVGEGLPASCGKFRHGNSENSEDRLMFSHLMYWEKGSRRDTYKIFPRKGEIWALFKNWNIKWSSDADHDRKYEYEFVEVLSEYIEGVGASVAYLGKVKGFVSLFCRTAKEGKDTHPIPSGELFRFSHRVPSFKLTGEEREGVPKGSFELDPACLPTGLEEIDAPADLKSEASNQPSGSRSKSSDNLKPMTQSEGCTSSSEADVKESHVHRKGDSAVDVILIEEDSPPQASDPDAIEIPDPEFFNFDAEKLQEKFQIDQIWSLYCPEDGLPKYYAQIKKIEFTPVFKLHIRWLEASQQQNGLILWRDRKMLAGCGRFKVSNGKTEEYTSTVSFSHLLKAEPAGKKNDYVISPRKGEVWALYKNWTAEIKCSDLENCEYEIVEVVKEADMQIAVQLLEQVDGFSSVFKTQMEGKIPVTKVIPRTELLKFSHQIPAFRLTEQRGGSLRGFLELDPLALPVHYFAS